MINLESSELEEVNIEEVLDIARNSINATESGELREGLILDLSNQLKDKFDRLENIEIKIKKKNKRLIRHLLKIYGLIKAIDNMSNESVEVPVEMQTLIDLTSDSMEHFLDDEFFPEVFRLYD
jgi:hypothetical protein